MSFVVYDAVINAGSIKQVRRARYQSNIEEIYGDASGAAAPAEIFGGRGEPSIDFESFDVAGALDLVSITAGLSISTGTVTVPWNQRNNGGTFTAGGTHYTLSATNGLLVPTEISAQQDDEGARVMLQFWGRSTDGITYPIATNVNQTLAAQSFVAQHALGPCSVNGTALTGVTGIRVLPGLEIIRETEDGGNYPTKLFIRHTRPMIEITTREVAASNSFAAGAVAMTSCVAHLRKRSGATFVADDDAGTPHIKFSLGDGMIFIENTEGNHTDSANLVLRCVGELLTVDTESDIT